LIDGLEDNDDPQVRFDVPSRLLHDLETGAVDIALCPVIDYQMSEHPLAIVPSGGIGCQGPTLTVRLFSRVPLESIRAVHADTDSHTSVVLMRVLMAERYGVKIRVIDFDARELSARASDDQAVLLIGDKVVTNEPAIERYPFQMDLGEAWLKH